MSTTTTGPLNDQARAIVEAVLEAIDIPYAATTGHEVTREAILRHRLMHTMVCLRGILDRADAPYPADLEASLAYLREKNAEHPATGYVTYEQAQARLKDGMDWMMAVLAEKS
jgi:hypothetical protein